MIRGFIDKLTREVLGLAKNAAPIEGSFRLGRQRLTARRQQKGVNSLLAVALGPVAICVIIGHQGAIHDGGHRARFGGTKNPGQFSHPARTQIPDRSPHQMTEVRLAEFFALTGSDHQQLGCGHPCGPAEERAFKRLAGQFARGLQLLQQIARFRRQSLHGATGGGRLFKAISDQS